MKAITKQSLLKRGFKEIYKNGYRLESENEKYKYKITLFTGSPPQCRPRLFKLEITKHSCLAFDHRDCDTWSFSLCTIIQYEEDIDNYLRIANIH